MKNEILPTKENLQSLTQKELQTMYYEYFNTEAPEGFTKSFLVKDILWRIEFGKNSDILQKRIDKLVSEYSKSKSVNISKVKQFEVTTGTKFIREFKGEKHEVIAIENGFKYKNKMYKSLSAIANVITGTHWNGKKFFGLRKPECSTRTAAVSRRSSAELNEGDVGLQAQSAETHKIFLSFFTNFIKVKHNHYCNCLLNDIFPEYHLWL